MSLAIMIRPADEADLPAILEIYNHAVRYSTATADLVPRTLEDRGNWFKSRKAASMPILVAVYGDNIVAGWASLGYFHERAGYRHTLENSVYVAENMSGQGVGTALLTELIRQAELLPIKAHAIVAAIDGENVASLRLHRNCGFEECGRLPQVMMKFNKWLDLVYMVRMLKQHEA